MNTIPKLLMHLAETQGKAVATRIKAFGLWESRTWSETETEVKQISGGFADIGLSKGDVVIIFGNNTPALYSAITACQVVGALPVPIHGSLVSDDLIHMMNSTNARYVVAQDQQQVDAVLAIEGKLGQALQKIIYLVKRSVEFYENDLLMSFDDLISRGQHYCSNQPEFFTQAVQGGNQDDIALLLFSSGVDRKPCPVQISYRNMLVIADYVAAQYEISQNDEVFVFVPMSLSQNLLFGYTLSYTKGVCINFPENQETIMENLTEINPTVLYAPSYVYKQIMAMIHQRIGVAKGFLSKLYYSCMADSARRKSSSMLGNLLITQPIRDLYGLANLRVALTGGDVINKDVFHFFRVLGIDLRQVYGMPETFGCLALQTKADDANHVGHVVRNMEVKFSDKGEILCKGANVSQGYFNDTDLDKKVFVDGWYHTGDIGEMNPDGRLIVYDKLSALTTTSDGKTYMPKVVEDIIKASPYIKEACVIGSKGQNLIAVVVAEHTSIATWANSKDIRYTGFSDLVEKKEIQQLIIEEISARNGAVEAQFPIRHFVLLNRMFSSQIGELTWTNKLRRQVITQSFAPLVEAVEKGLDSFQLVDPAVRNEEISFGIHQC